MTNATLSSGPAVGRGIVRAGSAGRTNAPARPTRTAVAVTTTAPAPSPIVGGDLPSARRDPSPTRAGLTSTRRGLAAWPARFLITAGVAMIPWLVYLGATLPAGATAAHWDAVWVGFDTAEAAGLFATGLLLRRRDPRRCLTAAATATLLAVDAWFDCGTAATSADRFVALAMAFGLELPLAAGLAVLAWRAFPRGGGR